MSDIPVIVLCGGRGTRMGDTLTKKELVDIGGRPLLWHVMRIYSAYGHNRFVLALGHLGDQVRRYFLEYEALTRDVILRLADPDNGNGRSHLRLCGPAEHPPWTVTLVDTGLSAEKAARVARVGDYIGQGRFFVTYGEAVGDVDLDALLAFHKRHGRLATVTGIQARLPYGVIEADEAGAVHGFDEKPRLPYWINGGFMLFEPDVLSLMRASSSGDLERDVLPRLAADGELRLYRHRGYWQSMKTLKDALDLKRDWAETAPWRVWDT